MSLEKLLQNLISEQEGVPPEAITCSFISERRQERPVPVDFSSGSEYGGHSTEGLVYIGDDEFKEEESRFEEFLSRF